ncbi:MAG: formate dehydrogenase accessory sulfurtransferase FdhD [Acidobacteriota bacterium]
MRPRTASLEFTNVTEWNAGRVRPHLDSLAGEEPLEIRIGETPVAVTMRTPGHDRELAAGFLFTEGLVEDPAEIDCINDPPAVGPRENRIAVVLRNGNFKPEDLRRNFFAASGCGICGKAAIESIRRRGLRMLDHGFSIAPEVLCELPEAIRSQQAIFERTGGLHAAALFDELGKLLVLREDIGRHNAVDKVIGWAALEGRLPLSRHVLLVSGRGGFEIVQKTLAARIPVLASVSAPSSLAVRMARELGLTLIGFLRGERFVIYAGDQRVLAAEGRRRGTSV